MARRKTVRAWLGRVLPFVLLSLSRRFEAKASLDMTTGAGLSRRTDAGSVLWRRVLAIAVLAWPVGSAAQDTWSTTSTVGADLRARHKAVWTGSKMIVWGGGLAAGGSAGGIYDPATDTWTPTGAGTTYSAAYLADHTALWTGSSMIVWGGLWVPRVGPPGNTVCGPGSGGLYDPATDTWTETNMTGAPMMRSQHTAVWTGSKMIVWGAKMSGCLHGDTGGVYDPAANTWAETSTTGAPDARAGHTAVWTGSKMIVWGGIGEGNYPRPVFNTGRLYDPATNTWTAMSAIGAPSGLYNHTAVWTGSRMIVWGGMTSSASVTNAGGIYDPATDTWTRVSMAGVPAGRQYHTAVWTGSKMVVWGGQGTSSIPLDTGGIYDPVTNSWAGIGMTGAPEARQYHTAVWTGSKMIVWGGSNASAALDTGGAYTPPALHFYTLTPCRFFDTREAALGGPNPLAGRSTTTVPVVSHCGVPPTARAVALNVTVTAPTGLGHLILFPDANPVPLVSAINYAAGQTRANNAVTPLGVTGGLGVFVGQASGTVHAVLDVAGYFE